VLISALIFGLGHFDTLGVVAASFVMGVVNALVLEKTRSIWVPVVIHAANNSLAVILVYAAAWLAQLIPGLS
jgi:membrane protease YdiL (CAAX protease family)